VFRTDAPTIRLRGPALGTFTAQKSTPAGTRADSMLLLEFLKKK
jgi:hypothetical protein